MAPRKGKQAGLTDQVVLITGCSTGIGRAFAVEFAGRGHRVFASARRPETLDEIEGPRLEVLRLDVTDPESIANAIATVIERAGRIDIVVNNAGQPLFGPLAELPLESLRRVLDTNLVGLLAVAQAAFPFMADRGSGRIVNVGSVVGLLPTPWGGAYCTTKAAVHMLSEVLRLEVSPLGIDVIEVQPGGVESNIANRGVQGLEPYSERTSRYRSMAAAISKRASLSQVGATSAAAFASDVVAAILRPQAPRVIRAGKGAHLAARLARLPGAVRDRVLTKRFGLDALRR